MSVITADDARSAWRDEDRLTYEDRRDMTAAAVAAVDLDGPTDLLDGAEHGRLARVAVRAIGCTLDDLRCSELRWLAGMVTLVLGLADVR